VKRCEEEECVEDIELIDEDRDVGGICESVEYVEDIDEDRLGDGDGDEVDMFGILDVSTMIVLVVVVVWVVVMSSKGVPLEVQF
jgi:hypothetical protein